MTDRPCQRSRWSRLGLGSPGGLIRLTAAVATTNSPHDGGGFPEILLVRDALQPREQLLAHVVPLRKERSDPVGHVRIRGKGHPSIVADRRSEADGISCKAGARYSRRSWLRSQRLQAHGTYASFVGL